MTPSQVFVEVLDEALSRTKMLMSDRSEARRCAYEALIGATALDFRPGAVTELAADPIVELHWSDVGPNANAALAAGWRLLYVGRDRDNELGVLLGRPASVAATVDAGSEGAG